ncbi:MAG: 5-carboxymethyl-2-hydroxymuconate isomerase [Sulfitobacter sp.]|nr:5-carboxymethyl-2-hydroxymuconate isomerase [Sulfitobacter sp.]
MPHFHIDYSRNLEARLDMAGFCTMLRDAAVETGLFPTAGIRIRAIAADHVVMADGDPDHAYLDLSIRMGAGRTDEAKKAAIKTIFDAAQTFCQPVLDSSSFMLSMEMRDIDPDLSPKVSSIRRYLPEEMA